MAFDSDRASQHGLVLLWSILPVSSFLLSAGLERCSVLGGGLSPLTQNRMGPGRLEGGSLFSLSAARVWKQQQFMQGVVWALLTIRWRICHEKKKKPPTILTPDQEVVLVVGSLIGRYGCNYAVDSALTDAFRSTAW